MRIGISEFEEGGGEEQNYEIVVVTTLKVDRERLKRYGFTGI